MKLIVAIFSLGLLSATCLAEEKPDRGWFFYEPEPVPAKMKSEDKLDKIKPQDNAKKPMTVAWMRKMIPILQERAYDDPTPENVAAYAYLVRALGDKAQRYTEVHMDLIKTDPFLDMNNSMPLNQSNRDEILNTAGEKNREALKLVAQKAAGLFVFFDSKCPFCKTQIAVVNRLAKKYKFDVQYVSVDGKGLPGAAGWVPDNGHAKMLGIKIYPTTILAIPPKTYVPVSFGLMAEDQLQAGILASAKAANLIPKDMIKDMSPFDRGVLTLEDMQDGAYDDPAKFVEYYKEKLGDRY
jgi:conjugal transfer pilus assembly protein TraF